MHHAPDDPRPSEGAVLRTMVLLATLSTAAEVRHAVRERRAGRDPSGQEAAADARAFLAQSVAELQEMLMGLQASLVYTTREHDEAPLPGLVRRFDDLMKLGRAARLLHLIHQRLLSLYPAVPEEVVEETRLVQLQAARLVEAGDDVRPAAAETFLYRTLVLALRLERVLVGQR